MKKRLKFYEVADDVFAVISPNNGLSWANAGFINHGKGLVFDTFFDLHHAHELKRFCVDTSGYEPAYVVNSHSDADHIFGNQAFSGATFIMHKNLPGEDPAERMQKKVAGFEKIIKEGKQGSKGQQWLNNEWDGFDLTGVVWQAPDILIDSDTTIMLNDLEVNILNLAPAHSDCDLLLWLPREKVVFCGDLVFEGGGETAHSERNMKLWLKALDFISDELKPEIVVPGHGALCGIEEIERCKAYFRSLLEQFDAYYTEDITAMELSKKIDIEKHMDCLQPERLFINVNGLITDRRGQPNPLNWDYFSEQMLILREHLVTKYGEHHWDPMSSWRE